MSFLIFVRYLKGTVRFCGESAEAEKFLNLLLKNGIPFTEPERKELSVSATVYAKDYRKTARIAKKCHFRIHITRKNGVAFSLYRYRKRLGISVGIALFFAFLLVMKSFVWSVKVTENSRYNTQYILDIAAKYGVKSGALTSSVDAVHAERSMLLELDGLSWLAVNLKHSTAYIEFRTAEPVPPLHLTDDALIDITAKYGGVVKRIDLYNGKALVKPGDAVNIGDTLVTGRVVINSTGKEELLHARATVTATVNHRITVSVPLVQNIREYSDSIFLKGINFLGLEIPLFFKAPKTDCEIIKTSEKVKFLWFDLPISVEKYEYIPYKEVQKNLSRSEAQAQARELLKMKKATDLDGAEIYSENTNGYVKDGNYTIVADYYCDIDIGTEKFISPLP